MAIGRSAVSLPRHGGMTQGTIFSCAIAENYSGCEVAGLVITARCDVANDKVRSYNYIPVVKLTDWLQFDGRLIIAERIHAEALGKMRSTLKQGGFSASILEVKTPREVLLGIFSEDSTEKKMKALRAGFSTACDDYEFALSGLSNEDKDQNFCQEAARRNPNLKTYLIGDLVNQKLAGYYFLEQIEPNGNDNGFVALVREVQNIPRLLAKAIEAGLAIRDYEILCDRDRSLTSRLQMMPVEFALPVGLLTSPYIEHFMQGFSNMFGRIGVPDPDPRYISTLWSRQLGLEETV